MKNLIAAILIASGSFLIIWLIAIGIDRLAHYNNDIKYYFIFGFIFCAIVAAIYIELEKDKKIENEKDIESN